MSTCAVPSVPRPWWAPAGLWLLAVLALGAAAAGVAEVPRLVVGFSLGCWACAFLRLGFEWNIEKAKMKAPDFEGTAATTASASPSTPAAGEAKMQAPDFEETTAMAASTTTSAASEAACCADATETLQAAEPLAPHVAGPGDGRAVPGHRHRPRSTALCAQVAGAGPQLPEGCTMLVLRGVPGRCTQEQLAERLRGIGYRDDVDLVHLPLDLKTACHMGYALVSFRTPEACVRFAREFHLAHSQALLPDMTGIGVLEVAPSPCRGGRSEYCRKFQGVLGSAKHSRRLQKLLPTLLD